MFSLAFSTELWAERSSSHRQRVSWFCKNELHCLHTVCAAAVCGDGKFALPAPENVETLVTCSKPEKDDLFWSAEAMVVILLCSRLNSNEIRKHTQKSV